MMEVLQLEQSRRESTLYKYEPEWSYLMGIISNAQAHVHTVDSHYYDTAGTRKQYPYIQTIDISRAKLNCLLVIGILKWYLNKQYFDISDILITRVHCKIIWGQSFLISEFVTVRWEFTYGFFVSIVFLTRSRVLVNIHTK